MFLIQKNFLIIKFVFFSDMETLPVKTTRQRSTNRWQIETPSPRDRELVAPVGYSNQRIALSQSQANQRVRYHKNFLIKLKLI